ncbi:putative ribose-phosphate pyrophosphokinase [Escherichia phage SUSP2]|uniref:Ribose-phosphate pyrophosphokinase n=1 Tax=Escherichia phage SUSP2 TaxID=1718669 RepID=A0A0N9SL87_9CAUD|nr:ribose-phosphate pyrophosphokinase [Escherichia phage SUSP2]ALH47104.1 putative ribose-phosphate pyrophosphokinase [Escherichia phage SUSP2]
MKTIITVLLHSQKKGAHQEEFNIIQFPSGEIGGNFSEELVTYAEKNASQIENVIFTVQGYNKDTLFALALAKEAIDKLIPQKATMKTVIFAYLPNARYDRHMFKGDAAALKVFANLVNAMDFDAVCALDAHSDVADNLFKCFQNIPQKEVAAHYASEPTIDFLVAPDAGAAKKIAETAKEVDKPYVTMAKVRDLKTGEITGMRLLDDVDLTGKTVLIIDDICDGGRTFIEAAKYLREAGAAKVELYVTHGIFSKGVENLLDNGISHIYTTDSLGSSKDRGLTHFGQVTVANIY